MRKTISLILLLTFYLTGYCQTDWVRFKLDSVVSVDFPGEPKPLKTMGLLVYTAVDSGASFVAMQVATGKTVTSPELLDSVYAGYVKGIKSTVQSTDLTVTNFTINNLRGVDVTYSGYVKNTFVYGRSRAVHVSGALYSFVYSSLSAEQRESGACERFLQSVRLNKAQTITQYGGNTKTSDFLTGYAMGRKYGTPLLGLLAILVVIATIYILVKTVGRGK